MENKPRIAVYTCITGGYDNLAIPNKIDNRFDYFCFSDDSKNVVAPWIFKSVHLPELDNLNNKDKQRFIKIHSHKFLPDYDATIYVDGKVHLVGDIYEFFLTAYRLPNDLSVFAHPERDCIYSEGAACSYYAHDWIWNIAAQMRKYSASDYPMNNGLVDTNVLVRKNTPNMAALMEAWWDSYYQGSKRDQLSFSYVSWKLKISINCLGKNNFKYFKIVNHAKKRSSPKIRFCKYVNWGVSLLFSYERLFSVSSSLSWKKPFRSI